MNRRGAQSLAIFAGAVLTLAGCVGAEGTPKGRAPAPPPPQGQPVHVGTGVIGPFGWQPAGLQNSRTGSGSLLSSGLPARGGGPASDTAVEPRGLAPDENIGSPMSDATERVVTDPVSQETAVYSHRRRY